MSLVERIADIVGRGVAIAGGMLVVFAVALIVGEAVLRRLRP